MLPDLFNHFSKYNIMKNYYNKIIRDIMNVRTFGEESEIFLPCDSVVQNY